MKEYGYVTKKGRFVKKDIMEGYVTKTAESRKLVGDRFQSTYSTAGLVAPIYSPESLAQVLGVNTYHYRACRTKARDIAGIGWTLTPLKDDPSEKEKKLVEDFFDNLSPSISSVLDKVMFDFESIGFACLEVVREGYMWDGNVLDIVHIPSSSIRVHSTEEKFCQIKGGRKRWYRAGGVQKDIDFETGAEYDTGSLEKEKRASELLFMVNYTPESDYYGLPDFIPAMGAIHGDIARRDYNIAFFDNFGVPAYAVFVTGNFDPGEEDETGRTELEASIEAHFQELNDNPFSTLILTIPTRSGDLNNDVKIEFKPLAVEVKEASFRLYRSDNRDEVLAAHGVPPYRMGIAETGSLGGSTAKESTEIYKRSIIEPRQEIIEGLINKFILGKGSDLYMKIKDYKWELAEIDTSDEAHDIDSIAKIFALGGMTPNQVIRYFADRFGLEESEDPSMDCHYINWTKVEKLEEEEEEEAEEEPNPANLLNAVPPLDPGIAAEEEQNSEELKALLNTKSKILRVAKSSLSGKDYLTLKGMMSDVG